MGYSPEYERQCLILFLTGHGIYPFAHERDHFLEIPIIIPGLGTVALPLMPHDGLHIITAWQFRQGRPCTLGKTFGKRKSQRHSPMGITVGLVLPEPFPTGIPYRFARLSRAGSNGCPSVGTFDGIEIGIHGPVYEIVRHIAKGESIPKPEITELARLRGTYKSVTEMAVREILKVYGKVFHCRPPLCIGLPGRDENTCRVLRQDRNRTHRQRQ